MSDVAFVAKGQIPASPPPATSRGFIGWVRENLFSSILNSVLTIGSILFVLWMLPGAIQWLFIDSVWNAGSLKECREINPHGACWAIINERWHQYTFGFYPQDLYWRPSLAMILMIVAFAPVLFSSVPRQLLWLTAAYPAIAYFLIWGGSIWGPILVMGALVAAYYAYQAVAEVAGPIAAVVAAILTPVILWLFVVEPLDGALYSILPIGLEKVESAKLGGFLLTFIIGVVGIAASLPIGVALAMGRQSNLIFIKSTSVMFIEFIRGVPLITLLFVASTMLNYFLPPGTEFDLTLRVLIMVTLFASAYMAEVIRGGLAALPKGQYEAADSLGLDYWKSMRLIILPQALKISIPGIVNTFIGLFKDTTLVIIIGLLDPLGLTTSIRADANWNGIVWEPYIFIAAFFFIFCFGMSRYSMHLERQLKTDHH